MVTPATPPSESARAWTFLPLMVAAGFAMAMTAPLELLFARRLGAGALELAVFIVVPAAGVVVVDLFGTRFVPRLDARATLAWGVLLFGLSSAALGVSPTFLPLLAGRAVQGIGAGLILGSALQAAVRINPVRDRALGAFNGSFLLGAALGAPAGGLLAGLVPGTGGYRMAFGVCCGLSVVVALGLRFVLPSLPAAPLTGRATIGFPRLVGPPGIGPALVLGMLGDFLRGGVVYTALPLAGQARHLSTATIGLAVGLLSGVEILTLRNSARLLGRFGIVPCLVAALGAGVGITSLLAAAAGATAFLGGALLFGVVIATATIAPPLVIVSLSNDDVATGMASYRISSGIGMLIGSTGVGVAIAVLGASGVFALVAGVLMVSIIVTLRVGRRLDRLVAA